MSEPEYMGNGPIAPTPEPPGMGSQQPAPAHPLTPEPASQKRGLIIAILIGVNILCLAAIVAVSGSSSKKQTPASAATEQAGKQEKEGAGAGKKAAEHPSAEPSAAAAAAAPKGDAPAAAEHAGDSAKSGGDGQHAIVTPPAGRSRGVLRVRPDAKSDLVVMLPAGTAVDVTSKKIVNTQIWYEVKTVDFDPPSTGWMHENVLKMP